MYRFLEVLAGNNGDSYKVIGHGAYIRSAEGICTLDVGDVIIYREPIINNDDRETVSCIFSKDNFLGILCPEDSYETIIEKLEL